MKIIHTTKAAAPLGHYSQAVVHNGLVYASGQLPIDPANPESATTDPAEQTRITLQNLQKVLIAAGSDLDHVLKTTVYIADISLWPTVNEAYAKIFGEHRPARSAVPTKNLPKGFLVEIEAIAAIC